MSASTTSASSKQQQEVLTNQQTGVSQEKLMQITCQCNVEKNGFQDKDINTKDKNKVLHVFRTTQTSSEGGAPKINIRFMLKYQKSGETALDFALRDITQIFNQNAHNGMLSLILNVGGPDSPNENNANSLNLSMRTQTSVGLINKQSNILQRTVGAASHSGLSINLSTGIQYKVLMSKMEPQLIDGLCKLIREEL